VFNASQLKSFTPNYTPVFSSLPSVSLLDSVEIEPEQILDHRLTKKGSATATQVLVKWSNVLKEMATWEDYYILKDRFPDVAVWRPAASQ
jgi:hypothetical protein